MKPKRVHFSKESICKSSIKNVKEFGLISSLCCNNKGIKLISNDEMFNTLLTLSCLLKFSSNHLTDFTIPSCILVK